MRWTSGCVPLIGTSECSGVEPDDGLPSPAITQEIGDGPMTAFIVLTCIVPTLTVALLVLATDTEL